MNNRYDIKIPNFSKLGKDDVVVITCDDMYKPSFKVHMYPYKGRNSEEHIAISVRRYIYYPHRVTGLVDSSLSFTVSIVDTEKRERFLRSFGMEHFFNLDWVASLKLEDESAHERLVSRNFLSDQCEELLKDDALTIRVDISYQTSKPSLDQCDTYEIKSSEVVKESDIQRLEFLELMEESLFELREFIFLYQDLQQLHESLGSLPDIESLDIYENTGDTVGFREIFKDMSECFRLHRFLQKGLTGALPYTNDLDEEEVKKIRSRLWFGLVCIHRSNVDILMDVMDSYKELMESRRIVLDREQEWGARMELVEARMKMIVRLFDLNGKLKERFRDRKWLNRDAEEVLMNEEKILGKKKPRNTLKENIQKMFDQYKSFKVESVKPDSFLEERIRFFIPFLSTIEVLTNLIFTISEVFFDWTQSLIERYLPKDTLQSKMTKKDNIKDQEEGNVFQHTVSDYSVSQITIETNTQNIVVPFVSKLLDCSPVFKKMFSHPFKEAIEGKLTIKHFDSVTVRDLLSFIDSGGNLREDMDRDECLSLYFMAHMYQVESLEENLADHLYSTMCTQSEKYVRKFSKRLGEEHPLGKVLDKFYDNMKLLDESSKGNILDNEPEFRNGLKDWAREQRMMYETEHNYNFYQ